MVNFLLNCKVTKFSREFSTSFCKYISPLRRSRSICLCFLLLSPCAAFNLRKCKLAESNSNNSVKSAVGGVQRTWPSYPSRKSMGILPEWSMCACVKTTRLINDASKGKKDLLTMGVSKSISRSMSVPQSINILYPSTSSSKYIEPVTCLAAPKNCNFIN